MPTPSRSVSTTATETITATSSLTGRPERIKVNIKRMVGGYNIECNKPVPALKFVISQLPKQHQANANAYHYTGLTIKAIVDSTNHLIPLSVWSRAIARACAKTIAVQPNVETELLALSGDAYLCMGNGLFRLEAVDFVETSAKALPVLRRAVLSSARTEAASLLAAAQASADSLHTEAQTRLQSTQRQINTAQLQLSELNSAIGAMPPDWVRAANLPFKIGMYGRPYVGFHIRLALTYFSWTGRLQANYNPHTYRISALPAPRLRIRLWAALPPNYDFTNICVDPWEPGLLPHISFVRSCMSLGDAPATLASINDYNRLVASVERVMSEFNMDSPLTAFHEWHPGLHAFVPPALLITFQQTTSRHLVDAIAANLTSLRPLFAATTPDPNESPDTAIFTVPPEGTTLPVTEPPAPLRNFRLATDAPEEEEDI